MNRLLKISWLAIAIACIACDATAAQDKKPPEVDWQKLLGELRERFAKSQIPALEQTRIDRASFSFDAKDPDRPLLLHVTGVALKTANDDEKAMLEVLHKELSKLPIPGTKFELKLDEIKFHDTPVYALQDAAVAAFKMNPTFNVFFERATYGADGVLQLHTLCLRYDQSTNGKITKLLADHPVQPELTRLPDGKKTKEPTVVRRDFDWLGVRLGLQRKFSGDPNLFMQRSRYDDGYFQYTENRKSVRFHVSGACIHPPALVAAAEREKRWKAPVTNLIPRVKYEADVSAIAMLPNPSIAWQAEAASTESRDGLFFRLAQFDYDGKLKFTVMLTDEAQKVDAQKLIAGKPPVGKLLPVQDKNIEFQTWAWQNVIPMTQARLAEGDLLQQRTRIDRAFMNYEPARGEPILHIHGVSLHPTELDKAEHLRAQLERSFAGVVPAPIEHRVDTAQIRFVASPIYAMQADAVTRKLDGLLFANGRYDEQGRFHLAIVTGAKGQREEAMKIVGPNPIRPGVLGKNAKDQPILDFSEIAWSDILHEKQRWLAKQNDTLLRKTRVDRAYFSYPPTKVGPTLNLEVVGIYPKSEALTARLIQRLDAHTAVLSDRLRAGPVTAAPMIEHVDDPAPLVQAKLHKMPSLDGIRLDDASFDSDGKLILHGIWVGKSHQKPLEKQIVELHTPDHPLLKRGHNWIGMQSFDSPALLTQMREFIAGQHDIDEVWLERFHFDAAGKERVAGFSTREADKERAAKRLRPLLPAFPRRKLPPIEGVKPEPAQESKDGPIALDSLTSIAQYLRDGIPKKRKCDGLRIDRCFYDAKGVLRIEGLADRDGQTQELKPFLEGDAPFNAKRQLAKSWAAGRQTVIPLSPMMLSLAENMPALPELDGITLHRAHHDSKNRLLLAGSTIGDPDVKQAAETLKRLLDTHPRWRLRLTAGLVLDLADKKPADIELAKTLTMKGLALLHVNIGEARVDPLPTASGWWCHAWPYDERLPRVRPSDADYAKALQWFDAAIANDPKNSLAWYLRGYVQQAMNRSDLTLRDFRRMVALEIDEPNLRDRRILDLELVQGRLRQSAYRVELEAIREVAEGWTLRHLRERPSVRNGSSER